MKKLALLFVLASCGLDNSLGGSLSEVFPLEISTVEVARNEEAMQVTYFRNRGVFLDVVARVSVSLQIDGVLEDGGVPHVAPEPGTKIEVVGDYAPGNPRCAVTTAPGGEPVRNLPRIQRGDFTITSGGDYGEDTAGNFSVLFEQEGGDVGFGRTLFGTFRGELRDAGFGELP
ncbi:MAG: hypothetical protein ACO1OB_28205 [Archangium sp.]